MIPGITVPVPFLPGDRNGFPRLPRAVKFLSLAFPFQRFKILWEK